MNPTPRDNYLVTEVTTATPQKLHLMLVEAALRSCHAALQHRRAGEDNRASEAIIHAQEIMSELIAGLNRDADSDLVKRVASIYLFIYRSLIEAGFVHDEGKVTGAIRVLEIERETWRQLCEQLGGTSPAGRADEATFQESLPPNSGSPPPIAIDFPSTAEYSGGFSLDA